MTVSHRITLFLGRLLILSGIPILTFNCQSLIGHVVQSVTCLAADACQSVYTFVSNKQLLTALLESVVR